MIDTYIFLSHQYRIIERFLRHPISMEDEYELFSRLYSQRIESTTSFSNFLALTYITKHKTMQVKISNDLELKITEKHLPSDFIW